RPVAERSPGQHPACGSCFQGLPTLPAMTTMPRRSFLARAGGAGAGVVVAGSLATVLGEAAFASRADRPGRGDRDGRRLGYGDLVTDPAGLLDLPAGFSYVAFSRTGVDSLDTGVPVPAGHDGMGAFRGRRGGSILVRNH